MAWLAPLPRWLRKEIPITDPGIPTRIGTAGRTGVLLALLTLIAGVLRTSGIDFGLPYQGDPDAVIVRQATGLEHGLPRWGEGEHISPLYPHLLPLTIEALPGEVAPLEEAEAPLALHLAAASRPDLLVRWVIALLATLAVPLTFLLARRFLSPAGALLAAAFLATSLLHVVYSRQARPHAALTTFCLLAVWGATLLARERSLRAALVCGVGAALAIGVLHSALSLGPPIAVAAIFFLVRSPRTRWPLLLGVAIPILVGLWWFYPFLFRGDVMGGRDMESVDEVFTFTSVAPALRSLWSFDPILTLLAAVGLLVPLGALRRPSAVTPERRSDGAIVLAHALPYLGVMFAYAVTPHRFLTVLTPYVAIGAALAVERGAALLSRRLATPAARVRVAWVAAALLLPVPAIAAGRWVVLAHRPNTYGVAAAWLEQHADRARDTIAVSVAVKLPLLRDARGWEGVPRALWSRLREYRARLMTDLGREGCYRLRPLFALEEGRVRRASAGNLPQILARLEPRYVVFEEPTWDPTWSQELGAALRSQGARRVARVEGYRYDRSVRNPDSPGRATALGYEALSVALTSPRHGQSIEIYELP